MTAKKINQTELNSWSEEVIEGAEIFLRNPNETEEQKEISRKVFSLFSTHIRLGNTFALLLVTEKSRERVALFNEDFRNKKYSVPCEDGQIRKMTHEEWYGYIFQRVEEHHKSRVGKELKDEELDSLIQRLKDIKGWGKEEKLQKKILGKIHQTDPRGYDLIWGIIDLNKEFKKLTGKSLLEGDDDDDRLNPEEIKEFRYFFTDLSNTVYKAQKALKEDDKSKDDKPNKKEKKYEVDLLNQQIERLKEQKKEIEKKLANSQLSLEKRKNLQTQLSESNQEINQKEERKNNLQRELQNPDNDKSNLAIGLGIFAGVVAVICLIILLARPSRRNQY